MNINLGNTGRLTKKEKQALGRQDRMLKREQAQRSQLRQRRLRQAALAITIVLVAVLVVVFRLNSQQNNISPIVQQRLSYQTLQLGSDATWEPNPNNLPALITVLNLPYTDPPQLHHHIHLDVYIEGHKIAVPANIGLSSEVAIPAHTHDSSGIVHIETVDTNFRPTLGLFFDVWGVAFATDRIGGYTNDGNNHLAIYVNGQPYTAAPRELALNQHDEIVVAFGSDSQLPQSIPASYEFPSGL